jgi:hypothetical protein
MQRWFVNLQIKLNGEIIETYAGFETIREAKVYRDCNFKDNNRVYISPRKKD